MSAQIRRREFITLLGGAAAWPLVAHGQQRVMHVIGTLHPASPRQALRDLRQGLKQEGFVEGHNVAIVTRSADGELDLLASFLAEMVQLRVAAIVAFGAAVLPAVAASRTGSGAEVPIVFAYGRDPVLTVWSPASAVPAAISPA